MGEYQKPKRVVLDDKFVKRTWDPEKKKLSVQIKRVAATCKVTKEEREAYAKHGTPRAVSMIRQRLGCGLKEAFDLFCAERGEDMSLEAQAKKARKA